MASRIQDGCCTYSNGLISLKTRQTDRQDNLLLFTSNLTEKWVQKIQRQVQQLPRESHTRRKVMRDMFPLRGTRTLFPFPFSVLVLRPRCAPTSPDSRSRSPLPQAPFDPD